MKVLVCTDGSKQSRFAVEQAALIAEGPNFDEVVVIHVDEGEPRYTALPWGEGYVPSEQEMENYRKMLEERKEERKNFLLEARQVFEEKGIRARTILKDGHPAQTIVGVAEEEGFGMIVIGSRGYGGLKRLFLGSVSNAVVQEAKNCCVVVVKHQSSQGL